MAKKLTKKQQRQINKTIKANWKVFLVLFLLIVTLGVVAYYMGWLDILFNKDEDPPVLSTAGGHVTVVEEFGALEVNFLKVGQADCIVIELPDNKTMLIDTGDDNEDRDVISNFLTANNITYIDYLLITHSDRDHVGNADWVLENYSVRYIFRPHVYSDNTLSAEISSDFNTEPTIEDTYVCSSDTYARFIVSAKNEGCTIEYFNKDSDFSNSMSCNGESKAYTFNFLTPTAKREEISYKEANDFSPIMMLEYAGKRVMFNGDAELDNLEEYVSTYDDAYDVDVLKVGHHGSNNATTQEYISAISPEYAVIQNGWHGTYKHPHQETLDILTNNNVSIYRTDNNGNIVLAISSQGNMTWEFDNDNMSKNLLNGTIMLELEAESAGISFSCQRNSPEQLLEMTDLCIINNGINKKKYMLIA